MMGWAGSGIGGWIKASWRLDWKLDRVVHLPKWDFFQKVLKVSIHYNKI